MLFSLDSSYRGMNTPHKGAPIFYSMLSRVG